MDILRTLSGMDAGPGPAYPSDAPAPKFDSGICRSIEGHGQGTNLRQVRSAQTKPVTAREREASRRQLEQH